MRIHVDPYRKKSVFCEGDGDAYMHFYSEFIVCYGN